MINYIIIDISRMLPYLVILNKKRKSSKYEKVEYPTN